MSRQASAEPITGPTRTARSRTMSVLSPAPAEAVPDSTAATNSHILREVISDSVRSARAGSLAFWLPPSGYLVDALWRCRSRLLSPLHELLEQLSRLALGRRIAGLSRGQKGLEFAGGGRRRCAVRLAGLEQGGLYRLHDPGRTGCFAIGLSRCRHDDDEEQCHQGRDADRGGEAHRDAAQRLARIQLVRIAGL